jgi:hypothetical protein
LITAMVFFPNSRSWKGSDKWRQNIKSNQYCIKISKTPKKFPKLLLKKRRNLSKKKITNQCPGNTTSTLLYVCWYWMTDLQSRMWSHALLHYSCISLWRIRYKVQKRVQTSPNCLHCLRKLHAQKRVPTACTHIFNTKLSKH